VTSTATTLPASWYSDPEIYAKERAAVFGAAWLCVARTAQLIHPGSYVATTIAGWPILVVVADDGELRAFYNVCRHRAGPLAWDGDGRAASLVCHYHGWSYDLCGNLRRARDFGGAEGSGGDEPAGVGLTGSGLTDVRPTGVRLTGVRVEAWRGLVFVNLSPGGPSLLADLGDFAAECAGFPMEDFVFSHEVVHDLPVNWKTYADNYLEGYHIPFVHPALSREIDAHQYRVDVGDRWCRHSAPARDGSMVAGRWLWRWPNLALNLYPDGMNVERFLPDGPRQTRVVYQYFFREGADGASREESTRVSAELLEEDRAICEVVQRNLESGAYEGGQLSPKHEQGVAAFQELVRHALSGGGRG
jgi:choline monooxygenase